jgi:hypothetical protein
LLLINVPFVLFVVGCLLSTALNNTTYAFARQAGGLEGLQPSKNLSFLVVVAGFADNDHQKNRDLGETPKGHPASPNPSTV